MDEVLRLQKENQHIKQQSKAIKRQEQLAVEAVFKLERQLNQLEMKAKMQENQRESESRKQCKKFAALKLEHEELLTSIVGPKVTSMKLLPIQSA